MPDTLSRLTSALADRYTIERVLGEGGMAIVYLATDLKLKRQVAIKVLRPELAAAMGTDRFVREVELTSQLEHPNILAIFDSGEADPGASKADLRRWFESGVVARWSSDLLP